MNNDLKILLVDDDKIILFLHETFLRRSGVLYETVLCYNGREAVDYLDNAEEPETTYLVLLDINMPEMDGWEFLECITKKPYLERALVVMVSSATESAERSRALSYQQVIEYVEKPLSLEICKNILSSRELHGYFRDVLSS